MGQGKFLALERKSVLNMTGTRFLNKKTTRTFIKSSNQQKGIVMRSIFLIIFIFPVLGFSSSSEFTANPKKHAEMLSREYSKGDSNRTTGWRGCTSFQNRNFVCTGTMEVLVHGGHWARHSFECHYSFQPMADIRFYRLVAEECQ